MQYILNIAKCGTAEFLWLWLNKLCKGNKDLPPSSGGLDDSFSSHSSVGSKNEVEVKSKETEVSAVRGDFFHSTAKSAFEFSGLLNAGIL